MPKVMTATPSTSRSRSRRTHFFMSSDVVVGGADHDVVAVFDGYVFESLDEFRKERIGDLEIKSPKILLLPETSVHACDTRGSS